MNKKALTLGIILYSSVIHSSGDATKSVQAIIKQSLESFNDPNLQEDDLKSDILTTVLQYIDPGQNPVESSNLLENSFKEEISKAVISDDDKKSIIEIFTESLSLALDLHCKPPVSVAKNTKSSASTIAPSTKNNTSNANQEEESDAGTVYYSAKSNWEANSTNVAETVIDSESSEELHETVADDQTHHDSEIDRYVDLGVISAENLDVMNVDNYTKQLLMYRFGNIRRPIKKNGKNITAESIKIEKFGADYFVFTCNRNNDNYEDIWTAHNKYFEPILDADGNPFSFKHYKRHKDKIIIYQESRFTIYDSNFNFIEEIPYNKDSKYFYPGTTIGKYRINGNSLYCDNEEIPITGEIGIKNPYDYISTENYNGLVIVIDFSGVTDDATIMDTLYMDTLYNHSELVRNSKGQAARGIITYLKKSQLFCVLKRDNKYRPQKIEFYAKNGNQISEIDVSSEDTRTTNVVIEFQDFIVIGRKFYDYRLNYLPDAEANYTFINDIVIDRSCENSFICHQSGSYVLDEKGNEVVGNKIDHIFNIEAHDLFVVHDYIGYQPQKRMYKISQFSDLPILVQVECEVVQLSEDCYYILDKESDSLILYGPENKQLSGLVKKENLAVKKNEVEFTIESPSNIAIHKVKLTGVIDKVQYLTKCRDYVAVPYGKKQYTVLNKNTRRPVLYMNKRIVGDKINFKPLSKKSHTVIVSTYKKQDDDSYKIDRTALLDDQEN